MSHRRSSISTHPFYIKRIPVTYAQAHILSLTLTYCRAQTTASLALGPSDHETVLGKHVALTLCLRHLTSQPWWPHALGDRPGMELFDNLRATVDMAEVHGELLEMGYAEGVLGRNGVRRRGYEAVARFYEEELGPRVEALGREIWIDGDSMRGME
ncbi:hypothetical protein BS50DRAFT_229692 [Corynespora cassiicola Philippines]|uniref:Uncharacterized protein n=1 Tax=Corynespora cassiicola Philippines TaxID=1448308 RepID=A0A2T2N270_CORCC|nr:hypothetical protein BS50DRAFT_229692 [Corynespora cassiicola Philippines]